MSVKCRRCNDTWWMCEDHPNDPWQHGCGAAGVPCRLCQPRERKPELPANWQSIASIDDELAAEPANILPKERGSIRNVTIAGDPVTYHCEVRTLPGSGLRPGDLVWVEFGAYWTEIQSERAKQRGQWRRCRVLPNAATTQADVHVKLDDLAPLEPFGRFTLSTSLKERVSALKAFL